MGFGAEGLRPIPQTFQALALGGSVRVARTRTAAVPVNLTLAAQPVFYAILRINSTLMVRINHPITARANATSAVTNPKLPVVVRQPAQSLPQANAESVARVVSTVRQLAISAVYPAPVFSFSA